MVNIKQTERYLREEWSPPKIKEKSQKGVTNWLCSYNPFYKSADTKTQIKTLESRCKKFTSIKHDLVKRLDSGQVKPQLLEVTKKQLAFFTAELDKSQKELAYLKKDSYWQTFQNTAKLVGPLVPGSGFMINSFALIAKGVNVTQSNLDQRSTNQKLKNVAIQAIQFGACCAIASVVKPYVGEAVSYAKANINYA